MNTEMIFDNDKRGFTRINTIGNTEKVNPIEFYRSLFIEIQAIYIKDHFFSQNPIYTSQLDDKFFREKAELIWLDHFNNSKIQDKYIKLLNETKKRAQEKLLGKIGSTLTSDEFYTLIFKSYDFGFLYSRYCFEILPSGLDEKKLPELFYKNSEEKIINVVGNTDLTDGQLKNLINHRKVTVSHFLEKENFWHCFFHTYNSISGKESGQSHIHYISSSFNISKKECLERMENGNYIKTSIHIDFIDYGKQDVK